MEYPSGCLICGNALLYSVYTKVHFLAMWRNSAAFDILHQTQPASITPKGG